MNQSDLQNTAPDNRRLAVRAIRWLLATLAVGCFAVGWVGLFVPGLPTTVFWIMAVLLAGKACPVLREWIYGQGQAGELVRGVVEQRQLPHRTKRHAILGLWMSLAVSMGVLLWLRGLHDPLAWLLPIIGLGVSWLILRGIATAEKA